MAKDFSIEYVQNFELIYGFDHVVSNVHNLIHVYDDVKRFGNLNSLSAYPFENGLRELKLRVHACGAPLDQIARRIIESADSLKMKPVDLSLPKWQPYLKYPFKLPSQSIHTTFKHVQIRPNVFLSMKKMGDSFFLTKDKQIVQMKYAFKMLDEYFICGVPFVNKNSFFEIPIDSREYDIYETDDQQRNSSIFGLNRIECKLVRISYKEKNVFIPLIHTIDELMK